MQRSPSISSVCNSIRQANTSSLLLAAKNKTADEDGFMGKLMEARKKADAKLVEATVPSDPTKV